MSLSELRVLQLKHGIPCQFFSLSEALDAPYLHALDPPNSLRQAIDTYTVPWNEHFATPRAVEVYTDGSAVYCHERECKVAAWAFVVVLRNQQLQPHVLGWKSGFVSTMSADGDQAQPINVDAFQAELEALFHACQWAFACPHVHAAVPLFLVSDAAVAIHGVDAQWSVQSREIVQTVIRPMLLGLHQMTQLWPQWQKAHNGCLFNELVDHVAKHQTAHKHISPVPIHVTQEEKQSLPWLWLAVKAQLQNGPVLFLADSLHFPVAPPLTGADEKCWIMHESVPAPAMQFDASVTTFNVNMLKDWVAKPGKGKTWTARTALLKEQARNQTILFLQETRAPRTTDWNSDAWFGFSAAACRGVGGIEIWFSKRNPIAFAHTDGQDTAVLLQPQCATVAHASSQILAVRYSDPFIQFFAVSAHAPHEHTDDLQKDRFWDLLSKVTDMADGLPVIIGLDGNARIGEFTDSAIGGHCPDAENNNGRRLHAYLLRHQLHVPSTFESTIWTTQETYGTWRSKTAWWRLDYVIVPMAWSPAKHTMTIDLIGLDLNFDDHVSLTDRIQVPLAPTHRQAKPKPQQPFDRHAMLTSEGRSLCWQAMHEFLQQVDQSAWQMPADQYAQSMHLHFHAALPAAFPKVRRKARATWLSDATWDLLTWSRRNRRSARQVRSHIRTSSLRRMFQDWRACCPSQQQSERWMTILRERQTSCIPDNAWLKAAYFAEAVYFRQAVRARQCLRVSLQQDEARNLELLAQDKKVQSASLHPGNMWRKLKHLTPKWRHMHRNRPVKYTVTQQALAHHFAEVESADLVPLQEVSAQLVHRQCHSVQCSPHEDLSLDQIPSILEVEQAIRHVHNHKATVGVTTAELFHACPMTAAQIVYPFVIKAVLDYQEAFTHKGGLLVPLWKKRGPASEPSSFRAILISSLVPKVMH